MTWHLRQFFILAVFLQTFSYADEVAELPKELISGGDVGVSANPSTVNILYGTGELGKLILHLKDDSAIRLGGVLLSDGGVILAGGDSSNKWSGNNMLVIGLHIDLEKLHFWRGGSLGASFMQFNGMDSNAMAGSIQGYDSLPDVSPFNRSQLYEIWFRQTFLEDRIVLRIGKTVPSYDFNNVLRPVPSQEKDLEIPAVSGLLYTPVFINPVNIGVLPGYYNSAYGVTMNTALPKEFYLSAGAYDGNEANGTQTGMTGPHFNGYYFYIAEAGRSWEAGELKKPGNIGVGGWIQTGKLSVPDVVHEKGAKGVYLFGSQRVWFPHPGVDNSGISLFWQLGYNASKTLPMNKFIGGGMTAFALTRPKDSFGMGFAWSWLNKRTHTRKSELMLQGYYQAHLFHTTYLEPVITYIPTPGAGKDLPQTWTATLQMINLF